MAITLVGIFDSLADAQRARQQLASNGIDESCVDISSAESAPGATSAYRQEDHRGFFARIFGIGDRDETSGHYAEALRRGSCAVTVRLEDENRADRVTELLENAGAVDVDERVAHWRTGGYAGYDPDAPTYSGSDLERERETLEVMQEELQVGKRAVQRGGVRIHRHVSERPVSEEVTLREERAVVERRDVDRPASEAELAAFGEQDRDIEIRETIEEPVVSKRARVVEEVRVGKEAREHTETINDTVRRTDVDIQELDGERLQARDDQPGEGMRNDSLDPGTRGRPKDRPSTSPRR